MPLQWRGKGSLCRRGFLGAAVANFLGMADELGQVRVGELRGQFARSLGSLGDVRPSAGFDHRALAIHC